MTTELELTAYHEAGHAVISHFEGVTVRRASVIPDAETQGHVLKKIAARFQPDIDSSSCRARKYIEALIMSSLAGHIAEERRAGVSISPDGAASDRETAADLAAYVNGSVKAAELYLAWLHERTVNKVDVRWWAVEAVAQSLLAHSTLSGREVRSIIRTRMAEMASR